MGVHILQKSKIETFGNRKKISYFVSKIPNFS